MNMKAPARTNTIISADEWPLRSDLQPLQLVFQTKPCVQTKMACPKTKSKTRINKATNSGDKSQKPCDPKGLFISVIVLLLTSTFSVTCNVASMGSMRLNK